MKAPLTFSIIISICCLLSVGCQPNTENQSPVNTMKALQKSGDLVVRFAKLEIDTSRLDECMVFLKEGIETSINTEPGVLTMYAVQDEDAPNKITILEVYASDSAYQSHLNTPHFQKYKTGTIEMVKSLELVDVEPIVFGVRE
ncbi:MAG: putative quinol monooxygenase [Cyclobacteriaceae bacterium]